MRVEAWRLDIYAGSECIEEVKSGPDGSFRFRAIRSHEWTSCLACTHSRYIEQPLTLVFVCDAPGRLAGAVFDADSDENMVLQDPEHFGVGRKLPPTVAGRRQEFEEMIRAQCLTPSRSSP
jgi:hypothetical protein